MGTMTTKLIGAFALAGLLEPARSAMKSLPMKLTFLILLALPAALIAQNATSVSK